MNIDQGHAPVQGVPTSGKLVRLAAMASTMAAELRYVELNQGARARMLRLHHQLIDELADLLRPELHAELTALRMRLDNQVAPPTTAELRIAHAQLKGWLESVMADTGRQLNASAASIDLPGHRKTTIDRRPWRAGRDAAAASSADHPHAAQSRGTRAPGAPTRTR
ncbi:proteasome activator [Nonomuraea jiangxiensis]|uniref:Bacterial proteasome activator n=1 Tax=Nonomuraea jiangxiensis TaxID=633440 RepID=A0A1G9Q4G6_9ACTN|nr:proteasome activator [Nonomuraea jiangxiensis]SDM05397.1 Protein of unknown function [Nonomuraea jiangxiensis]